jgi:hypothetical protein
VFQIVDDEVSSRSLDDSTNSRRGKLEHKRAEYRLSISKSSPNVIVPHGKLSIGRLPGNSPTRPRRAKPKSFVKSKSSGHPMTHHRNGAAFFARE